MDHLSRSQGHRTLLAATNERGSADMLGIKQKNQPATASENQSPLTAPRGMRQSTVNPARQILLGNHLAFAVSSESVSVALCSHAVSRRKLIDVRKVYIPHDLTGTEQ